MVFARTTGATYVSGTVTCLCHARLISSHPTVIDAMPTRKLRFAVDSPVEGDGFELPVPRIIMPAVRYGRGCRARFRRLYSRPGSASAGSDQHRTARRFEV